LNIIADRGGKVSTGPGSPNISLGDKIKGDTRVSISKSTKIIYYASGFFSGVLASIIAAFIYNLIK
jgi:hypothetical protein